MAKRGRKPKYTEAIVAEIVNNISVGLTNRDAARSAGIHEDTFYDWINKYPDFSEATTRARSRRTRRWLGYLHDAAERGDVRAIAELLDRCSPDYRKTERVELSGPGGGPIASADVSRYTMEELEELAQIEERAIARRRASARETNSAS